MQNGTSTAPKCIGYVIVNTEDGPEVAACKDPCCTDPKLAGAAKFRARSDVKANGFSNAMLADIADDEAF
jgi:hypothetical protein